MRPNSSMHRKTTRGLMAALLFVGTAAAFSPAVCRAADHVVTDQLGRTMRVPTDPRRVVSLAPSITEIVFALGQQERLAGVSRFSDYPEAARRLPKVGSYVHLDLERIVGLGPDLCLAIKDGNPIGVIERLEAMKIPVYAVHPDGLDTVLATVLEVGRVLNAAERAHELVSGLEQRIARIDRTVGGATARPRVFFQIGVAPIVSAGADTFIHALIERAGGFNAAGASRGYPRFSREQVLVLAPEVMIITSMARGALFEEVRAEWMQWESMPAVQGGRVYIQDSNLFDRPTPRLVDGLELLARLIHPELFEEAP